jgi:urease accessory protein
VRTWLSVGRTGGRHVARLGGGPLRPQLVSVDDRRCRVALLATTALLLGGDTVELDVEVRAGACLDLFDVAGTVAYSGRGVPAGWHVRVTVAEGATLRYAGEPFVVADGADVTRTLDLDVGAGGGVLLRDTVVLGRSGERGGRLRSRTSVCVGGAPVLREDQDLDPDRDRCAPGLLGPHRVLDTVLRLGPGLPPPVDAVSYALVGGAGTVTRWLGSSLAESPLGRT